MSETKIIRHIEEKHSNNSIPKRDGLVSEDETYLIEKYYAPNILHAVDSTSPDKIVIVSSDTIRSKMTSALLKKQLRLGLKNDIPIELTTDPNSEALRHGEYVKSKHEDYMSIVDEAKKAYVVETFVNNNPWYKIGDPIFDIENGSFKYPNFKEVFDVYGENQVEISIRFYRFVLNLLEANQSNILLVISSHYVIISRLLSLQYIANHEISSVLVPYFGNGELYKKEWDAGVEILEGKKFHEFFQSHNYIFNLDLSTIQKMQNAIQSDLDILVAQYMQRYGKII